MIHHPPCVPSPVKRDYRRVQTSGRLGDDKPTSQELAQAFRARLWGMDSEKPPRKSALTTVGLALFISAVALLFTAVRPSPALSLDRHWQVFGKYAGLAALLFVGASLLVGRRYRIVVC